MRDRVTDGEVLLVEGVVDEEELLMKRVTDGKSHWWKESLIGGLCTRNGYAHKGEANYKNYALGMNPQLRLKMVKS